MVLIATKSGLSSLSSPCSPFAHGSVDAAKFEALDRYSIATEYWMLNGAP